jgi:bisanhydrobacterioruberin hydratase
MQKPMKQKLAAYFFLIYYTVGVAGLSIPSTRQLFISLMPLSLLLSASILLFFHNRWRRTDILIFFIIAISGYLIEVIGVHTGEVFGSYSYGRALGFTLLDTPLLIGLNWLMLTYCVFAMMESTKLFWPLKALLAAMLMVVYDIVMEPVAIRIDMWSWGNGPIPLQNYQAWFIISLVFLVTMHLAGIKTKNKVAPWLFGTQFVFFLLLNLSLRLF